MKLKAKVRDAAGRYLAWKKCDGGLVAKNPYWTEEGGWNDGLQAEDREIIIGHFFRDHPEARK